MSAAEKLHIEHRVLFIDDEANVRQAFRHLLRRDGFSVDVAESGSEALALANHHRYQVIVTDLSMPGMDGTTLIERLRLVQNDASYIAVTGLRRADANRQRVADRGFLVFDKPWDAAALREAIRVAAVSRTGVDPSPIAPHAEMGFRILLVEDNPADAELFEYGLRGALGHDSSVVHLSDLRSALQSLATEKFDVVVADLSLPDAHDLESVIAIQSVAPDVPIVVMTGTDDDVALRAIQAGAQDFLVKGQTAGLLLKRVLRYSIERKMSEQRLVRMAHYDPLTGLANRTLFRERLAHAIARGRRTNCAFCVLALDLDRFKEVNDDLGHEAGDRLLKRVAAALVSSVRESDTVARFGGDEFVVLLEPISHVEEVSGVCERVLHAIAVPQELGANGAAVTASIGVASYPNAGDCADLLLRAADEAMYAAKSAGETATDWQVSRMDSRVADARYPSTPSDREGIAFRAYHLVLQCASLTSAGKTA